MSTQLASRARAAAAMFWCTLGGTLAASVGTGGGGSSAGRPCSASTSTPLRRALRVGRVRRAAGSWSIAITGAQPSLRGDDREHAGAAAESANAPPGSRSSSASRHMHGRRVGARAECALGVVDDHVDQPVAPAREPSGRTTIRPPIGRRRSIAARRRSSASSGASSSSVASSAPPAAASSSRATGASP